MMSLKCKILENQGHQFGENKTKEGLTTLQPEQFVKGRRQNYRNMPLNTGARSERYRAAFKNKVIKRPMVMHAHLSKLMGSNAFIYEGHLIVSSVTSHKIIFSSFIQN